MPKRLLDRWRPESIREFRVAARQRFDDALSLAISGRRTGAIYLWGYSAEMLIKAGYFSAIGMAERNTITWANDIGPAIVKGRNLKINWPHSGQGHNVRAWSELLIITRNLSSNPYPRAFSNQFLRHAQRVEKLWSESLRYHCNVPYLHELASVREAAEWFLANSDDM
jgi:hypothetical protein